MLVLCSTPSINDGGNEIRLNGDNGYQLEIAAGRTETYVSTYEKAEVKSIALFIDSTDWDPNIPVTMKSGDIVLSNMAFFTDESSADLPALRFTSESQQYVFTVNPDGFHVEYTRTKWNSYAGVNVWVDNWAVLGAFGKLTFKTQNHSATYQANYVVQILDGDGEKVFETNGTFARGQYSDVYCGMERIERVESSHLYRRYVAGCRRCRRRCGRQSYFFGIPIFCVKV